MTAPQSSDARLAKEVAAYWTRLAYESIIAFTWTQQAERGYSQRQFWLQRHLSTQDLAADDEGMTLPELAPAVAELPARGRRSGVGERHARPTRLAGAGRTAPENSDLGEQARVTIGSHAPEIRALIHQGIDDADHATTIKVLQRLIRNTRPA